MATFFGRSGLRFKVEMDLSATGAFGGRSAVEIIDITEWVMRITGKVGRDSQNTPMGFVEAGKMTLTLLNTDGRFNPAFPGSPYFGKLRPFTPVRFSLTREGITGVFTPVATMYLDDVQTITDAQGRATAQFTCLGVMSYLQQENTRINLLGITGYRSVDVYALEMLKQAFRSTEDTMVGTYWDIDTCLQFLPANYLLVEALAGSHSTAPAALSGLRYLERVENGLMYETPDGKLAFKNRRWRWTQRCYLSGGFTDRPAEYYGRITGIGAGTGARRIPYQTIEDDESWDTIFNRFVVGRSTLLPARTTTLFIYDEGALPVAIPAGTDFEVEATYNRNVEEGDPAYNFARSVIQWNLPVIRNQAAAPNKARSDFWITLDESPMDDGSLVVPALYTITLTNQNAAFCNVRIQNNGTQPIYLQKLQVQGRYALHRSAYEIRVEDTNSIAVYGEKIWEYPIEFLLFKDDEDRVGRLQVAEATKNYLLWLQTLFKEPQVARKVTFAPDGAGTALIRRITIGEMVEVTNAERGLNRDYYSLEAYEWDILRTGEATWGFYLSPLHQTAPWACVGSPATIVGSRNALVGY